MIRQARGEGLAVGEVLTWAPSWYYQKEFFTGHAVSPAAASLSTQTTGRQPCDLATARDAGGSQVSFPRYDVEVSGFPSSHAGHLVLLRLKEQDYPGTKIIEDWPSWNLPILKWVGSQGGLGGYAHCGIGNGLLNSQLIFPNYEHSTHGRY